MDRDDPRYDEFKRLFWEWFDLLPSHKKRVYWRHKDDLAESIYYFSVYLKIGR